MAASERAMTVLKVVPEGRSRAYFGTAEATLHADCHNGRPGYDAPAGAARSLRADSPQGAPPADLTSSRHAANRSALFMSETVEELNIGAHFLDRLSSGERTQIQNLGRQIIVRQGEAVFSQGDHHAGIFIIDRGQVRVYYTAPSGREITLAYWTPGHFIGGPEISG